MIQSTAIVERRRATLPVAPDLPAAEPAVKHGTAPVRLLPGTRSCWGMRLTYLTSDVVANGLSLALSGLDIAFALGVWAVLTSLVALKLHLLLACSLVFVAATARTYSAVPPRPVRQFRGWVLGSITACAALVAGSWLLDVGSSAIYLSLAVGTTVSILMASFLRAVCRIAFGKLSWWGTGLIVVGTSGLSAKAFGELKREPQWGLRPAGFVDD